MAVRLFGKLSDKIPGPEDGCDGCNRNAQNIPSCLLGNSRDYLPSPEQQIAPNDDKSMFT
jgi:hypothetical protein